MQIFGNEVVGLRERDGHYVLPLSQGGELAARAVVLAVALPAPGAFPANTN